MAQFLACPSHRISYVADGPVGLPWLILVNGLATDVSLWAPQLDDLRRLRRVLRFDARGHGLSSCPASGFEIAHLADDVIALMDYLEISVADVAGISLGGMTALSLALSHPERVGALAVCNARATMPAPAREGWQRRIAIVRDSGIEAIAEPTLDRWFTNAADPQARAAARSMILATSQAGYCGCAEAITRMNLEPQLGGLQVSTVFVAGEHDGAAPAEAMEAMAAKASGRFRVVKDAAHLPNLEQPASFNAILCEWLAAN